MPRIVSLLPAATEITYAVGAGEYLVGRSHECDYPPQAASLPVVSRPALPLGELYREEIDAAVAARLAGGESLYEIDEVLLRALEPDLILTQDLCQVCAPSGTELSRALHSLPDPPAVLYLTPRTMAEIEENIVAVGDATGRRYDAERLVQEGRERIERVREAVSGVKRRHVLFLEWAEPLFCAGHWVPEMIAIAGGRDPLGRPGGDSRRITWEEALASAPEIVVAAPCGCGLEQAAEVAMGLPEIGDARVYAVDANAYFARPGPRAAEGVELLAHLFHPESFPWPHFHRPWAEMA